MQGINIPVLLVLAIRRIGVETVGTYSFGTSPEVGESLIQIRASGKISLQGLTSIPEVSYWDMTKKIPTISNFPKIHCPFVRRKFSVDQEDWRRLGRQLQLRSPEAYLVVDVVNPGYEWVFDSPETFAVEKLDGSNVKVLAENGRIVAAKNRENDLDLLEIGSNKMFLAEGILLSAARGRLQHDGIQSGEVVGPKLQGNPYHLLVHEWYPFDIAAKELRYNSFHKYDRTFDNWSSWFENHLFSLFYRKNRPRTTDAPESVMSEGVVFYNLARKAEGKTYMAKLRRDMFDWYYEGVEIIEYNKNADPEEPGSQNIVGGG